MSFGVFEKAILIACVLVKGNRTVTILMHETKIGHHKADVSKDAVRASRNSKMTQRFSLSNTYFYNDNNNNNNNSKPKQAKNKQQQ